MFKKLLFVSVAAIALSACNNTPKPVEEAPENQPTEIKASIADVAIDSFDSLAPGLVDQNIRIEGTVMHICQHGGKRMFIAGTNPDNRIKVLASEELNAFNAEWEGSLVTVTGILHEQRIDETYLADWEAKLATTEDKPEELHKGEPGHEHQEGDDNAALKQIEDLRLELKESGKEYLSFFSIEATQAECKTMIEETAEAQTADEEK